MWSLLERLGIMFVLFFVVGWLVFLWMADDKRDGGSK